MLMTWGTQPVPGCDDKQALSWSCRDEPHPLTGQALTRDSCGLWLQQKPRIRKKASPTKLYLISRWNFLCHCCPLPFDFKPLSFVLRKRPFPSYTKPYLVGLREVQSPT